VTNSSSPSQVSSESAATPHFVQGLGLFSATAIVVGSMIGSGVFIVAADIARGVDSPALFIGAWLVTAIMTIIGALSYGELAAMMPRAGGQYVYLREALGPLWGFLYGWTLFLVIQRPVPSRPWPWPSESSSASSSHPSPQRTGCGTLAMCRRGM
jgi:basic amino acid/polyamine antiporter, APA family